MAGLVTLIEIASALVGALEAVLSKAILRKSIRAGLNLRKIAVTRILREGRDAKDQNECGHGRTAVDEFTHVTPQQSCGPKSVLENRCPLLAHDWPDERNSTRGQEHYKNKTKIKSVRAVESAISSSPISSSKGSENLAPDQGRIIRQAGLFDQLRSTPTTHHSTSQVDPIIPMSSPIR